MLALTNILFIYLFVFSDPKYLEICIVYLHIIIIYFYCFIVMSVFSEHSFEFQTKMSTINCSYHYCKYLNTLYQVFVIVLVFYKNDHNQMISRKLYENYMKPLHTITIYALSILAQLAAVSWAYCMMITILLSIFPVISGMLVKYKAPYYLYWFMIFWTVLHSIFSDFNDHINESIVFVGKYCRTSTSH